MKILNKLSILNCVEDDLELHNEEIEIIVNEVYKLPNFNCVIIFENKDVANIEKKDVIKTCQLHDFMDMLEYVDMKNGFDFAFNNKGIFVIIAYGGEYKLNEKNHLVETHIKILPYNEQNNFINLSVFFTRK